MDYSNLKAFSLLLEKRTIEDFEGKVVVLKIDEFEVLSLLE